MTYYDYLFTFALLSRISDLLTTWLVTPKLKLEANPLARKFRWPFAFLTLLTAFLAYWAPEVTVILTTGSFLVAASNATRIPMALTLGEESYFQLAIQHAAKGKFWTGWLARMAPVFFYTFLAIFIFFFYPTPDSWGFWIAYGVAIYCFVYALYGTTSFIKYRKLGRALAENLVAG